MRRCNSRREGQFGAMAFGKGGVGRIENLNLNGRRYFKLEPDG
jgi:hypothetical protein